MIEIFLIAALVLLSVSIVLLFILIKQSSKLNLQQIESQLFSFEKNQEKTERTLKEEIARNREETSNSSKDMREELGRSLTTFNTSLLTNMANIANLQKDQLDIFAKQLATLTASNEDKLRTMTLTIEEKLRLLQEQINSNAKDNRDELSKSLKSFEDRFGASVQEFNELTISVIIRLNWFSPLS